MIGENKRQLATGAAVIAESLTPPKSALALVSVRLNMDAVGGAAENFTITINSATNAVYDTILFSQDMNTVQDLMWTPDQPIPILNSDVLDFAYNNGNTNTWGLEIVYRSI